MLKKLGGVLKKLEGELKKFVGIVKIFNGYKKKSTKKVVHIKRRIEENLQMFVHIKDYLS